LSKFPGFLLETKRFKRRLNPIKTLSNTFALRPATTSIQLAVKSLNFAPDATGGVSQNKDWHYKF
jgi:hypothetical protein